MMMKGERLIRSFSVCPLSRLSSTPASTSYYRSDLLRPEDAEGPAFRKLDDFWPRIRSLRLAFLNLLMPAANGSMAHTS